jgi:hypothetical protein
MVRKYGCLISAALVAGLIVGCDTARTKQSKTAPTTAPAFAEATTQPEWSPDAPATEPASTQPATSQLTIDNQVWKFPTARLRVSKSGNHVVARLYTNDPKSAINDDYKGNGYYLVMSLDDIREPQQIYTAQWQHKAHSREFVDSPSGIFLEGMKYQIQPFDVTAKFLGDMLLVRIDLAGEFLQFDSTDPSAPPKSVYVKGSLLAPVEYKD